ncbi:hypothetical protein QBC37DRAFT_440623 [Rhypophila decipiens]|uniref:Mfs allantoate protein n=1 Tax=Rhypophila decipiens TaxID=261697 RepID=A0AAN6Y7A3_9PEZI|nr:hypothetical protein QBC37DRAFT_440623 [Rhypophila decipiens]
MGTTLDHLDALAAQEPAFLRKTKKSLVAQTFEDIQTEEELQEVHTYLFKRYVLLGKVISARNLHHKHFYSMEMDYGHQAYLDKLVQTRHAVTQALESLEKRTAQILYQREKWFEWVREVQDDQDKNRQKEQKKIKLEAALFRRHWKEMEARLRAAREKEEKKRQEAYLDDAWRERMKERAESGEETDSGEEWDPIEDVFEDDRARYIHLIRHFLWMGDGEKKDELPDLVPVDAEPGSQDVKIGDAAAAEKENGDEQADAAPGQEGKKKRKRGGKNKKKKTVSPEVVAEQAQAAKKEPAREPDEGLIKSKEDIFTRLKMGVEKDYSHVDGPLLVGTAHNPPELLFSHSKLLPAALRAKSIQEFLADPSISDSDLRDLCLQVEKPSLQALRDACADYFRGDEPDDYEDEEEKEEEEREKNQTIHEYIRHHARYGDLDDGYLFRSFLSRLSRDKLGETEKLAQEVDDDTEMVNKKMKVTVCGRSIWNYASQRRMARDDWLHFSILAKDCSFDDAIALCRNWDDGNFLTEELTQMGFIPFFMDLSAEKSTTYNQMKSVSRKLVRRLESRNFVCAHMKRNDPITRRFIQYALMRPGELFILVCDGMNGRTVTAPQECHRWLVRSRAGNSRFRPGIEPTGQKHSRDDGWDVGMEVNGDFFELAEKERSWHFGFKSYYEIYLWDFSPGREFMDMYYNIRDLLIKAHRVRGCRDKFKHMRPIMETLTREPDTKRVRQAKPGEMTLYDELAGPDADPYASYNDTDAAEDAILFEEEMKEGVPENIPFVEISNPVQMLESTPMPLNSEDEDSSDDSDTGGKEKAPYTPGQDEFPFKAPPIWEQQHNLFKASNLGSDRKALLDRLDFSSVKLKVSTKKIFKLKSQEIMERDRAYIFKDTFHLGDFEPGAQERYRESQKLIISLQKHSSPFPQQHQWAWFCMQVLDWMKLKLTYDDYNPDVNSPWPHRYILQDIVQAFMTMGLFFPNLAVTSVIQEFLNKTPEGEKFKDSKIFDRGYRASRIPDIRTRTSCAYRPKKFWEEWEKVYPGDDTFIDAFPWDWNMAIRPTIAKLYRAGIIGPAALQVHPDVVPGFAVANTEPQRPGKLDLFITYSNVNTFVKGMPPNFIQYKDWPDLRAAARKFSTSKQFSADKPPRFALLRLWSAPYYYPLMMMLGMRQHVSFIDPVGRAWEWKFIPKDMPMSEWSLHNTTMLRLGFLREQLMGLGCGTGFVTPINRPKPWQEGKFAAGDKWAHGKSEMDDRVVHRGDLVLVMGEGEEDLLKWCMAVTFALQTKPWLREVDLWKSFVNIGLDELEGLDEYWLD